MRLMAVALLTGLTGCSAIGPIAGVVAGGITGGATANPAVGFAVGVATAAAADIGLKWVGRTRQRGEQDAIAEAAGPLEPGQQAVWRIDHDIPVGNAQGRLEVVSVIENPLAPCKRIAFSVDDDGKEAWYAADLCQQAGGWKWASAEPAVERWGVLQ